MGKIKPPQEIARITFVYGPQPVYPVPPNAAPRDRADVASREWWFELDPEGFVTVWFNPTGDEWRRGETVHRKALTDPYRLLPKATGSLP